MACKDTYLFQHHSEVQFLLWFKANSQPWSPWKVKKKMTPFLHTIAWGKHTQSETVERGKKGGMGPNSKSQPYGSPYYLMFPLSVWKTSIVRIVPRSAACSSTSHPFWNHPVPVNIDLSVCSERSIWGNTSQDGRVGKPRRSFKKAKSFKSLKTFIPLSLWWNPGGFWVDFISSFVLF